MFSPFSEGFGYPCWPKKKMEVNQGKFRIVKEMSLFRNNRNFNWGHRNYSSLRERLLEQAIFMGKEWRRREFSYSFFKQKNKQIPALKIPPADKTCPAAQIKFSPTYFARSTWPGSSPAYLSRNLKQKFPNVDLRQPRPTPYHLRKFQHHLFSVHLTFKGDRFSQHLSFVSLRAHAWDIPFHVLCFHCGWKFLHCLNVNSGHNGWRLPTDYRSIVDFTPFVLSNTTGLAPSYKQVSFVNFSFSEV